MAGAVSPRSLVAMTVPSDPSIYFTPSRVLGAPHCRWRAVRQADGILRLDRRVMPGGPWVEQTAEELAAEVEHGTEAGGWLGRLRAAGLLS